MRCAHTHDSGPYVLGALLSAEREAYEAHLAGCPSCREEVADLAVLPGLLGRLDLATVESLPPDTDDLPDGTADLAAGEWGPDGRSPADWTPGERMPGERATGERATGERVPGDRVPGGDSGRGSGGYPGSPPGRPRNEADRGSRSPGGSLGARPAASLPGLLSAARRRRSGQRRRGRWRLVATAVVSAAVAVVALLGVRSVTGTPPPEQRPANLVVMQPVGQYSGVAGWISVKPFDGGSRVHMRCAYTNGAPGSRWTYRLVAVSRAGAEDQIGSWTSGYGEEVTIEATTALARDAIARIELRSGGGAALLTYDVA